MRNIRHAALLLTILGSACGDDDAGPGSLRVDLVAEETITGGIPVKGNGSAGDAAGGEDHGTLDYAVSYSKYIAVVGQVSISKTNGSRNAELPATYIADLRAVGTTGVTLTTIDDLASGQWDQFGYATPIATAGFTKLGTISDADAQAMVDQGLTYWIEGEVASTPPVKFSIKVPLPTKFSRCETNGEPGIAITEGRTATAQLTLHGDHLWFTTLVRGDESTVQLRSDWIVKADKDGDQRVTSDDLKLVKAEEVFPTSEGYNLSNGALPISTAYDFARAQLISQGHLNGEGECDSMLQQ